MDNNMRASFRIIDNIAIQDSDNYFDVHNNFELGKIEITHNEIKLFFEKTEEDWGKNELYDILQISHINIDSYSFVSFNKNFNKTSLTSISFSPRDNFDIDTIFLKDSPEEGDEIIYSFEDDSYIRISCNDISLSYFKL
ncbi:hypothetical protein [Chryseobacterium polytrichastri]|uniref:Uncharacterized protein n=1 Tax=Chryseobacterium polytrichastri TaxID=1302687 RepID=A0A1M7DLJ3_9FLAO|nr:hypothetical protein [Chryseobacterium polytrichastri]SHL80039.1 hypothetical protein SAMN05444267_102528 [Chryseobacterium polytrichastri]